MIKLWSDEEAEAELRAAIGLVERIQPPPDLRGLVFNAAVTLTTQRIPSQRPGGLAIPTLGQAH
jgi:hypothetical protein